MAHFVSELVVLTSLGERIFYMNELSSIFFYTVVEIVYNGNNTKGLKSTWHLKYAGHNIKNDVQFFFLFQPKHLTILRDII